MTERLEDELVASGILREFAEPFCRTFGPQQAQFIKDFRKSPNFWKTLVEDEIEYFALLGLFTSEQRFIEHMESIGRQAYIHIMFVLKAIYQSDFDSLVDGARESARRCFTEDSEGWAMPLLKMDNLWFQDQTVGQRLLDALSSMKAKQRGGAIAKCPFVIHDRDEYFKKIVLPLTAGLKWIAEKHGYQTLIDLLHWSGVTGLSRETIEGDFFHGKGSQETGLLHYKHHPKQDVEMSTCLGAAYRARTKRAEERLEEFYASVVSEFPEYSQDRLRLVSAAHN